VPAIPIPLELVIFDCDGVLVDSEPLSNAVLAGALTRAGLPTTSEQAVATYKGLHIRDVLEHAERALGHPLPADFVPAYEDARAQAFQRELVPVAGAAETVAVVKTAGVAVCVASQGKRSKTELTLGLTGLRSLFGEDAVFSAHSVARGKPHPDLFLHATRPARPPGLVATSSIRGSRPSRVRRVSALRAGSRPAVTRSRASAAGSGVASSIPATATAPLGCPAPDRGGQRLGEAARIGRAQEPRANVIVFAITMTDLLIRGLDADDLERLDARARRLGLSRGEYVRRRLRADARPLVAVSVADLERLARELPDLGDDAVMAGAWS